MTKGNPNDTSRPWQTVGTDLFHLDEETYSLVADYYLKFTFVHKMHKLCTSHEVIGTLKSIFSEHGTPEHMISDNNLHYDSCAFKPFTKIWDFKHVTSPTYAESNGFMVVTVKNVMKKTEDSRTDINMDQLYLKMTLRDYKLPDPTELLYSKVKELERICWGKIKYTRDNRSNKKYGKDTMIRGSVTDQPSTVTKIYCHSESADRNIGLVWFLCLMAYQPL